MTKVLYIYPELSDDLWRSFMVDEHTDVGELHDLIKEEFGLPPDYKLCFTWYKPEDSSQHVVPMSSLKALLVAQNSSEISIRLRNHPPLFPHPGQGNSTEATNTTMPHSTGAGGRDPWENDVYFGQYAQMYIHWEMLSDKRRCGAYYSAVMAHKNDFKDKIVLDVGCGTGLLSVYAALAGAKKVYAVDACGIVQQAQSVVKINGFQDIIEVIQGQVEFIQLPVKSVDIIISEWMGYFLIFESMLESVLFARDKWLAKDGLLFPCEANLYLAAVDYSKFFKDRIEFFLQPVENVNVSPLLPYVREEFTSRCLRCHEIKPEEVISEPFVLKKIDLKTVTISQIRNTKEEFEFKISPSLHPFCHGFGTWFDVTFKGTDPNITPVVLSTHPTAGYSHWRQDVFLFKKPIQITEKGTLKGTIRVSQMQEWKRHFVIQINAGENGNDHYREWTI